MAGVAWGSIGLFARWLLNMGLTPLDVAWLRGGVSLLGLIPLVLYRQRGWPPLAREDIKLFAAFGLVNGALYNIFYFTAVNRVGVTTAVILLYTAPAFAALFAHLAFGEPLSRGKVGAVALCLGGCFLVAQGYNLAALQLNLAGVLAGLGSGITYGLYGIFGKSARARYPAEVTVLYCTLFGTLFLTLLHPPLTLAEQAHGAAFWGPALGLGLWGSLVPWVAYTTGVGLVEAGRAAVVASVEPVVGVVLAVVLLGERVAVLQGVGVALVLGAVLLAQVPAPGGPGGAKVLVEK